MGRRASLCLGLVLGARGAGRGPNGLWSVNSKLALVADSNLDGLALVDLQYGGLVERRVFDTEPNSREGAVSVSAVASCDTCAFALAASEEASKLYRVYLPRPLRASLASSEDFGLASATVEATVDASFGTLRDLVLTSDGATAYAADHANGKIWKIGTGAVDGRLPAGAAIAVSAFADCDKCQGLQLLPDERSLLVTTESHGVSVLATADGRLKQRVDVPETCSGKGAEFHAATWDPTNNRTLLVAAYRDDRGSLLLELPNALRAELVDGYEYAPSYAPTATPTAAPVAETAKEKRRDERQDAADAYSYSYEDIAAAAANATDGAVDAFSYSYDVVATVVDDDDASSVVHHKKGVADDDMIEDDKTDSAAKAADDDDDSSAVKKNKKSSDGDDDDGARRLKSKSSDGDDAADDDAASSSKKSDKSSEDDDASSKKSDKSSEDDDASSKKSSKSSEDDDDSKKSSKSSEDDDDSKKSSKSSEDDDDAKSSKKGASDDDADFDDVPAVSWKDVGASPCRVLSGNDASGSGWLDGHAGVAHLSRLHDVSIVDGDSVLLADTDNRALRVVSLADTKRGGHRADVRSVIYDARRAPLAPPEASHRSCEDLGWTYLPVVGGGGPSGDGVCASTRQTKGAATESSFFAAKAACTEKGARMCELHEIERAAKEGAGRELFETLLASPAWTTFVCESCYMEEENTCADTTALERAPTVANGTTGAHSTWRSGYAAVRAQGGTLETTCAKAEEAKTVICCADAAAAPSKAPSVEPSSHAPTTYMPTKSPSTLAPSTYKPTAQPTYPPTLVPSTAAPSDWECCNDAYVDELASDCDRYDDDGLYGSMTACSLSDYQSEYRHRMEMTPKYGELCNVTAVDSDKGRSWGLICAWEALLDLEAVCAGTFVATTPKKAMDLPPDLDDAPVGDALDIDGECATHAFCLSCVDDMARTDPACRRAVKKYGTTVVTESGSNFFLDLDDWCAWSANKTAEVAATMTSQITGQVMNPIGPGAEDFAVEPAPSKQRDSTFVSPEALAYAGLSAPKDEHGVLARDSATASKKVAPADLAAASSESLASGPWAAPALLAAAAVATVAVAASRKRTRKAARSPEAQTLLGSP